MRSSFTAVLCLALLAGCQAAGVGNFWEKHRIDYTDIRAAEDQFADFAELAAAAPAEEAFAALDDLFDQLKQDTVAYYLYSEWMEGAFYNLLSPCRSAALYGKSVDRIVADGVLTENDYAPYLRRREWIGYNLEGHRLSSPEYPRSTPAPWCWCWTWAVLPAAKPWKNWAVTRSGRIFGNWPSAWATDPIPTFPAGNSCSRRTGWPFSTSE